MNTIGIICEYNPFHNGHAHQLQAIRQMHKDSTIIAIMSGSFVQRGEPAYFSKFDRAHWAILGGADVVIELPTIYSLGSAGIFSTGAIRMMKALHIDAISFGTELEDMSLLKESARYLITSDAQEKIKLALQQGFPYGTAMRHVLVEHMPNADGLMSAPNAILGLEYIRSALTYHEELDIIPVHRLSDHHERELPQGASTNKTTALPSGTALRSALQERQDITSYVPPCIAEEINKCIAQGHYVQYDRYYDALLGINRMLTLEKLQEFADFTEGIEHRWAQALRKPTWNQVIETIKTKRYTYARLQRMGAYTALGVSKELMQRAHTEGPQYARLLAFNHGGRQWLKQVSPEIPLITKWAHAEAVITKFFAESTLITELLALDDRAMDLQAFAFVNESLRTGGLNYIHSPRYID